MIIKFFSTGTGKGKGPVEYCIKEIVPQYDPETRRRIPGQFQHRDPAPEIFSGNPARTQSLIDSIERKNRYTSGVIAFGLEDNPSSKQQSELMAEFERVAFAGMEREQYDILWVKHSHASGVELHFIVPKVELTSGKALNIAPPGWKKTFDPLRDYWNHKEGWARPDDPARARLVQVEHHIAKSDAARLRAGLSQGDNPKALITDYLSARIEAGMIENRAGIVAALQEAGLELNRAGKDYLSVRTKAQPQAKPIRLKGAIYADSFQHSELVREAQKQDSARPSTARSHDQERIRSASEQLESAIQRRAEYHSRTYEGGSRTANDDAQKADRRAESIVSNELREPQSTNQEARSVEPVDMAQADGHKHECLSGYLRRQLGANAVVCEEHLLADRKEPGIKARDHSATEKLESVRAEDLGGRVQRGQERPLFSASDRNRGPEWLDIWQTRSSETWQSMKGNYDRIRETFSGWVTEIGKTIRRGYEAFGGAERAVVSTCTDYVRANEVLNQNAGELECKTRRVVRGLNMQREGELERFKNEINLVEYAQKSQGYEVERKESSRSSVVMRRGEDKIVIATNHDGHGVYFSLRNERDQGTIIDFIQSRQRLNLGQVRKELRPWIKGNSLSKDLGLERMVEHLMDRGISKPEPTSKESQEVQLEWVKMQRVDGGRHDYLEKVRKIKKATLADSRFIDKVRVDTKGNAVFAHYDEKGALTGYELKNKKFTGFSRNGRKALWYTNNLSSASKVVLVESAIDAMSHAQIEKNGAETAYISTGGTMSGYQCELMEGELKKATNRAASIIIATDRDEAGQKLASRLYDLVPYEGRVQRQEPSIGKDWNEQVQQRSRERERALEMDYGMSL
jgi:5S rRNA maturation endonuclease (ribonuclease M5)